MSINQLVEKILDKWPAKVICFLVAIFLYVFHQVSLVDKKTFVVPVTVSQNGMVCVNSQLPSSVTVSVRASSENLNAVLSSDVHAYLNLNDYTETGVVDVPVELRLSDKVLHFDPFEVRVNPEFVSVKLEIKTAKYVKVAPTIVGEVAHGYEISNVEVNPSYAEVIGPENVMNRLEYIETSKVMVSNANKDFSTEAEYLPVNKLLEVVDKGPYKVTFSITPAEMEKVYDAVSVLPLHLNKKFTLVNEIDSVTVKLKGSVLNLEKYSPAINTVCVDLRDVSAPGVYEVPLVYNIPSAFTLLEKSAETVTLQIAEVPAGEEEPEENTESEQHEEGVKIPSESYTDFSGGAV